MYNWIQIIGDYNSSTKYLHNLLEKNLKIKVSSGHFVHKHQYFPIEFIKEHPDILFFIVHRDFIKWIGSCYRHSHLLMNKKGQIKEQEKTINDMINWEMGFPNEVNYGTEKMKKYYTTLGPRYNHGSITWYKNMMEYRNKKTEFYLKLLEFDNVISIDDNNLLTNSVPLIMKLSNRYKIDKKIRNIPKYIKNGTKYKDLNIPLINKILNLKNEKLLNEKSIKL